MTNGEGRMTKEGSGFRVQRSVSDEATERRRHEGAEGAEEFSHRWTQMSTDDPRRHTKWHEEMETGNRGVV